jgi:hypothetical protein
MSRRQPTPAEVAATIVFHDRYATQRNGAIEFWRTLSAGDQDMIDRLVRAVAECQARPDPTSPQCPKRCDVATRPEWVALGHYVCQACGTEFPWASDAVDDIDEPTAPVAVQVADGDAAPADADGEQLRRTAIVVPFHAHN